ncbi:hypothetical protein OG909_25920 [Streptomyces sp. NBC_01754]|uniref:hypothetical protein n=1 Tax=Streptomyces sp. NBC_01754 TaxID=2975930 RepID=UPI002DDBCFB6|nr:hypothetical protein [Streptomyces sp. NBC_01754]WSC95448.1 hypothetical protein OG909_25920 [Streptomyces sp. NBC_01754]
MTENAYPLRRPRVTVLPVQDGDPPYRLVEIDGEVAGTAAAMTDVLAVAATAGIRINDLDDLDTVRWVGGDKLTWKRH